MCVGIDAQSTLLTQKVTLPRPQKRKDTAICLAKKFPQTKQGLQDKCIPGRLEF